MSHGTSYSRRRLCATASLRWVAWVGVFGCLPFLLSMLFHYFDVEQWLSPPELFRHGDALLVAVAFFGSALAEAHATVRSARTPILEAVVPWIIISTIASASLFGYAWPRIDAGSLTTVQTELLGWISLVLLLTSLTVGVFCCWQAKASEYMGNEHAFPRAEGAD